MRLYFVSLRHPRRVKRFRRSPGAARCGNCGDLQPGNWGELQPGNYSELQPGNCGELQPGNCGELQPRRNGSALLRFLLRRRAAVLLRHTERGRSRIRRSHSPRPNKAHQLLRLIAAYCGSPRRRPGPHARICLARHGGAGGRGRRSGCRCFISAVLRRRDASALSAIRLRHERGGVVARAAVGAAAGGAGPAQYGATRLR